MLLVITAAFVGIATAIYFILLRSKGKRKPLPPYNSASLYDNCTAPSKQKTLFIHERNRRLFSEVTPNDFGGTSFGAVLQCRVPFKDAFFMTSDYVLAKKVLQGDSKDGVTEGEKTFFLKSLNFLDRNEYNLLTQMSSNEARERARKTIAQAFSSSNLTRTWPHIKGVIQEQFIEFEKSSVTNNVIDIRTTVVHFFMRTLSRGAFGIEFTTDGTENENNINGLQYLHAMETAARESFRENSTPFAEYMFWTEGAIANKAAVKTLHRVAEKLVSLNGEKTTQRQATGVETKPFSILDFVALHAYSKEISRLSDLAILTFAGIDTTAFTFCFLLMEMCRNPAVKTKLQAELATFMPARGVCASSHASETRDTVESSDKELLSAIAGCEYLNWCVKEILRLWPAVANGPTRKVMQDVEYQGMLIPKGSLVVASFFSMFRERWIDQPDVYLPERWSDSNPQLPQLKEMLMPFSLGKRACIGQNMAMFQLRIVAAHFLHYFDFELAAEVTFEHFLTLKPDQLLMRVHKR